MLKSRSSSVAPTPSSVAPSSVVLSSVVLSSVDPSSVDPSSSIAPSQSAINEVTFEIASRAETLGGGLAHFFGKIVDWFTGSKKQPEEEAEEEEEVAAEQEATYAFLQNTTPDVKFIMKFNRFLHEPTAEAKAEIISYAVVNQDQFDMNTMTKSFLLLLRNDSKTNPQINEALDELVKLFFPIMDVNNRVTLVFAAIMYEDEALFQLLKKLHQMKRIQAGASDEQSPLDLFLNKDLKEAKTFLLSDPYFIPDFSAEQLICANGTVLDSDSFRIHVESCHQRYLQRKSQKVEGEEEVADPEQERQNCMKSIRG